MADFTNINAEIEQLKADMTQSSTVVASAIALINSQADLTKAAVAKALEDDNAADQQSIAAAMAAIDSVRTPLVADAAALAAAVTANTPSAPPATPPAPTA